MLQGPEYLMERSLKNIALVVTVGTLISKGGGLIRQLVLAGAFGVGAAYNAYNYAYVLPGFLLVLLGGINGPFHNAMVSVLSRQPEEENAYVLAALNTLVSSALLVITILLILFADPLIHLLGPGLNRELHHIAVVQLRLMAPIALFAGLIGLGFGSLNAANEFFIPAISPLMSSLALIFGVGIFWIYIGPEISSSDFSFLGGVVLAIATLGGAIMQWLIQLPSLFKKGLGKINFIWDLNHPGVKDVIKVIWPATLSSGMLQINVFTDLFFASGIFGAAAGLDYSNLLVQTPLGLISSALLIPLLPTFSKLTKAEDLPKLKKRIKQGLMLSTTCMVPIGALFMVLRDPIVSIVYQRGAFDTQATSLVSGLLLIYGLGMPAYLGRDLLVRVFYALGNGSTPFKFSAAGIVLNIFLDWILVSKFEAQGLVLATVIINFLTCLGLLIKLHYQIGGLPLRQWSFDIIKIIIAGGMCGCSALLLKTKINWADNFLGLTLEVMLSSIAALIVFIIMSRLLGNKEILELTKSLKFRLNSH